MSRITGGGIGGILAVEQGLHSYSRTDRAGQGKNPSLITAKPEAQASATSPMASGPTALGQVSRAYRRGALTGTARS